MLILRKNLSRALTWNELDHNQEVLEINEWTAKDYEINAKVYVEDEGIVTLYTCVHSHQSNIYLPDNIFITSYLGITLWYAIASTGGSGGTSGYSGYQGYQGATGSGGGDSGYSGYQGAQGYQGATGSQGDLGTSGYSGYQGQTGAGTSGYSGYQGATGSQGDLGTSGYSGYQGQTGAGTSGYSGYQGATGSQGDLGTSGYSGYQGQTGAGTSGYSGYQGATGSQGDLGTSGYSGYQGQTGAGTSGYSGYQGYQGISGYSGYQGESGYSGYQGYQGTSGYSGYQGVQGNQGATINGSLILNGDGECASDWLNTGGIPNYWGTTLQNGDLENAHGTIINNESGFTNNAWKIVVVDTTPIELAYPCAAYETSFNLVETVTYSLTFDYRSNVDFDIFDHEGNVYTTLPESPSTITSATLEFEAASSTNLYFGGASSGLTAGDWWILDKVTLKCESCSGNTLTINNNADTRILTANGTNTSIDAEQNLTYADGVLSNIANRETKFSQQTFATDKNAVFEIIRGRGTSTSPDFVRTDDILYKQVVRAYYDDGDSVELSDIFEMRVVAKENFSGATEGLNEYIISTCSNGLGADTLTDTLVINAAGDIVIKKSLQIDKSFNTKINTSSATGVTLSDAYFTLLCDVRGNDMDVDLPRANTCSGRIYYIAVDDQTASYKVTVRAYSGDNIGWSHSTVELTAKTHFLFIQSDGNANWLVFSINKTTI